MTYQIPDTCVFDGRRWEVLHWDGDRSCVPCNQELSIQTVSTSTANWSGRIDHFLVWGCHLYLARIQVELAGEPESTFLEKIRREVVLRYEPMQYFDANGERTVIREYRHEYLIFDDLKIPFTGSLSLRGPHFEDWEIPGIALDYEPEQVEISLHFQSGELIDPDGIVASPHLMEPLNDLVQSCQNQWDIESLWEFCTAENRLVPMPPQWNELYGMLKNTRQKPSGGWEPPLPLILGAWHHSMPIEKQLRFQEHIRWAEAQGQLEEVGAFLRSLPEEQWCHVGEI